jgi:hypothetical protein
MKLIHMIQHVTNEIISGVAWAYLCAYITDIEEVDTCRHSHVPRKVYIILLLWLIGS